VCERVAQKLAMGARTLVSSGRVLACRRVDAVDLGARQPLEGVDAELLGEGVDARVLEELVARVVDRGRSGILLQDALAW
jgi:hypothetical protein